MGSLSKKLLEIQKQPNEWKLIGSYKTRQSAQTMLRYCRQRYPLFEFETGEVQDDRPTIYARLSDQPKQAKQ